jgi:hypothetical protein
MFNCYFFYLFFIVYILFITLSIDTSKKISKLSRLNISSFVPSYGFKSEFRALYSSAKEEQSNTNDFVPRDSIKNVISRVEALKAANLNTPTFLPPWADDKYFFHLHEAMETKTNADTQTQDSNMADKQAGLTNQDPEITDNEAFETKQEQKLNLSVPHNGEKETLQTEDTPKDTLPGTVVHIMKELESKSDTVALKPGECTSLPTEEGCFLGADSSVRRPRFKWRKRVIDLLRRGGQMLCGIYRCGREEQES